MDAPAASREKLLPLPGGRTLAYEDYGNRASSTVVIFFHQLLSVGSVSCICAAVRERDLHYIAPTLPGWGRTSSVPRPQGKNYAACILSDISALLAHLHPDPQEVRLLVAGEGYGAVAAQILYGAPYDLFQWGRCIAGMSLMHPYSYFRYHKGYQKSMAWGPYLFIGPPAQLSNNIMLYMAKVLVRQHLRSPTLASKMLREAYFGRMHAPEREALGQWQARTGIAHGRYANMLYNQMLRSVAKTWDGFLGCADVLRSDWGFDPRALDNKHRCPLLVTICTKETDVSPKMGEWILDTYGNGRKLVFDVQGLSVAFHADQIWNDFFAMCNATK